MMTIFKWTTVYIHTISLEKQQQMEAPVTTAPLTVWKQIWNTTRLHMNFIKTQETEICVITCLWKQKPFQIIISMK